VPPPNRAPRDRGPAHASTEPTANRSPASVPGAAAPNAATARAVEAARSGAPGTDDAARHIDLFPRSLFLPPAAQSPDLLGPRAQGAPLPELPSPAEGEASPELDRALRLALDPVLGNLPEEKRLTLDTAIMGAVRAGSGFLMSYAMAEAGIPPGQQKVVLGIVQHTIQPLSLKFTF